MKRRNRTGGVQALGAVLLALAAQPATAANLALGKAYVLQPAPNYELTTDRGDAAQLTDGRRVSGRLWTQKEAVGWQSPGLVQLTLDLGQRLRIENVCVNTVRGESGGVAFPDRMDIFLSDDDKRYAPAGRLTVPQTQREGSYQTRRVCAKPNRSGGRFVLLTFKPRGSYFFLDEVEVEGSGERPADSLWTSIAKPGIRRWLEEELTRETERRAWVEAARISPASAPEASASALRDRLFAENRRRLGARSRASVIAWRGDPWAPFTALEPPAIDGGAEAGQIDLMRGGHASAAVNVVNTAAHTVRCEVGITPQPIARMEVSLREAVPVLLANGTFRADPLAPLGKKLELRPGEARQIWMTLRAGDQSSGERTLGVSFDCGQTSSPPPQTFKVHIHEVSIDRRDLPAVNVWAYLDARAIAALPEAAVADLRAHHANVAILSDAQMPWPTFSGTDTRQWQLDFSAFDRALARVGESRMTLLYLELSHPDRLTFGGRLTFGSEPWKTVVREWTRKLTLHLQSKGIGADRVAFYPVDEPRTDEHFDIIREFSEQLRASQPQALVFSTLSRTDPLRAARLARTVDIVQVDESKVDALSLAAIRSSKARVWSYAASAVGGKAADPLSFYRLQAWRAFSNGLSGLGFWSYADAGSSGDAWNDLDDRRPDHAAIYVREGQLLSSKRWEAWREGVEDFCLLAQAKRAGVANLDEAVDSVTGTRRAQVMQVRRTLLQSLARAPR